MRLKKHYRDVKPILEKHGYTWEDFGKIQDNESRVKIRYSKRYPEKYCTESIAHMLYLATMYGGLENYMLGEAITTAILEALREVSEQREGVKA